MLFGDVQIFLVLVAKIDENKTACLPLLCIHVSNLCRVSMQSLLESIVSFCAEPQRA